MTKVINKGLYQLPSVDTAKGTFFIRNYLNEESKPGVIIYDENGQFKADVIEMKYKEDQDYLIDRMINFIERSSIF